MPPTGKKQKKKEGDIIVVFHGIEESLKRRFKALCALEKISMDSKIKQLIEKAVVQETV